jgi:hypothetical protein
MKKLILLSGLACCIYMTGFAQTTIEFIPQGGYTFGDRLEFASSFGKVDAGFNYGGSFQFNFNRRIGLEIMYNRMQVPAQLYNYGAVPGDIPIYQTSAGINYIMAGPVSRFHFLVPPCLYSWALISVLRFLPRLLIVFQAMRLLPMGFRQVQIFFVDPGSAFVWWSPAWNSTHEFRILFW